MRRVLAQHGGPLRARRIRVRRVRIDNGTGYKRIFGAAAAELGVRWTRAKPYHPWTNGWVERFNECSRATVSVPGPALLRPDRGR